MKIDRKKLIERLSVKTGLDETETGKLIDRMISETIEVTEDGKEVDLGSFGTFQWDEHALAFSPSEALETELNRKYVGLEPIELIGAYQRQSAASGREQFGGHVVEADRPEGPAPPAKQQPEPEEIEEGDKIPAAETVRKPVGTGKSTADTRTYGWIGRDGGDLKKSEIRRGDSESGSDGPPKRVPKKRRSDPIGTVLTAAVALLLVLGGGWLAWEYGFDHSGGDTGTVEISGDRPDSGIPPMNPGETETDDPPASGGEVEEPPEVPSEWGLTGTVSGAGGYTIVVHSLNEEGVARELEETFLEQGYRVVVRSTTVNGTRYWRVGLGEFETVPDAQEAVGELPEPYRSDHFIRRIQ